MELMQQHVTGERPALPAELCRLRAAGDAADGTRARGSLRSTWRRCSPRWTSCRPRQSRAPNPSGRRPRHGQLRNRPPELQQLREEHALLAELLRVDRAALRQFHGLCRAHPGRARVQLQRRTHEAEAVTRTSSIACTGCTRACCDGPGVVVPSLSQLLRRTPCMRWMRRAATRRAPAMRCCRRWCASTAVFLALLDHRPAHRRALERAPCAARVAAPAWPRCSAGRARANDGSQTSQLARGAAAAQRSVGRRAGQAHPAHHASASTRCPRSRSPPSTTC